MTPLLGSLPGPKPVLARFEIQFRPAQRAPPPASSLITSWGVALAAIGPAHRARTVGADHTAALGRGRRCPSPQKISSKTNTSGRRRCSRLIAVICTHCHDSSPGSRATRWTSRTGPPPTTALRCSSPFCSPCVWRHRAATCPAKIGSSVRSRSRCAHGGCFLQHHQSPLNHRVFPFAANAAASADVGGTRSRQSRPRFFRRAQRAVRDPVSAPLRLAVLARAERRYRRRAARRRHVRRDPRLFFQDDGVGLLRATAGAV